MKVFNLVFLSLGFALASVFVVCCVGGAFFGDQAPYVVMPVALLIGLSARRITEKALGYTMSEAAKEDSRG